MTNAPVIPIRKALKLCPGARWYAHSNITVLNLLCHLISRFRFTDCRYPLFSTRCVTQPLRMAQFQHPKRLINPLQTAESAVNARFVTMSVSLYIDAEAQHYRLFKRCDRPEPCARRPLDKCSALGHSYRRLNACEKIIPGLAIQYRMDIFSVFR
jgi:hypothetical protein